MSDWLGNSFPVETVSGKGGIRSLSFWTADEADDKSERKLGNLLGGISPQRTQLDLDKVGDAREFVNLLLGGSTNRWANSNLASGFYTALTGRPLVPHVVRTEAKNIRADRGATLPASVPCMLRPGLKDVVIDPGGTASAYMKEALKRYGGRYDLYAKTGTLDIKDEGANMSRIVLALVNRSSRRCPDDITSGVLISFFVEEAEQGTATKWLNTYLAGESSDDDRRAVLIDEFMKSAATR